MSTGGRPSQPAASSGKAGRRAVVVAGMHRSGTSALSHALALRGLALPRSPMGPSPANELGHWGESEPIRHLHDELLAEAGSSWDDVAPFPAEWRRSAAGERWRERMVAALADEYPGDEPLLFKDPRLCRLVPFWLEVFAAAGIAPSFVLAVRNPLEVAASLARRDGFDQAKGLLLWLRHVLDAERDTRGEPRVVVTYDELLRDWRACLERVATALELPPSRVGHRAELEVERSLAAGERHHDRSQADLEARPEVVAWVKEAHAVLLAAAEAGAEPDRAALDEIRSALAAADLAYGPLLAAQLIDGERERAAWQAERERLERRAAELEAAVARHAAQSSELEQELARAREEQAALRAELDDARARIAQLERRWRRLRRLPELAARLRPGGRRPAAPAAAGVPGADPRRAAGQLAAWLLKPPSPRGLRMLREYLALRRAPEFDREWYLQRNYDVANAGMDPVMHYIEHGAPAGLDPSPSFSTREYLARHPELAKRGTNPLYHHLRAGRRPRLRAGQRGAPGPGAEDPDPAAPVAFAPPAPPPPRARPRDVVARLEVPERELEAAREVLADRAPTVSVIVPTYNRAAGVRAALRSALGQTHRPLEVIVCDDGSDDGTEQQVREEFAAAIAAGELRYLRAERRAGPSAARNRGLAEARGELVAYLDSDNTWDPDFLLVMAAALAERDDAATAYCGLAVRDDRDGPPEPRFAPWEREQLLIRNFIDLNAFVHRRRLHAQLGGFDEGLSRLVDWDLILRYTRPYPPVEVPYCLVRYYGGERGERVTHVEEFEANSARIRARFAHEGAASGQAPLRIAYVLWDYPALSQTFVLNEIRRLAGAGYDVRVYHHADPDRAARLDFDVPSFRVAGPEELAGLLREHRRTMIHSHFAYPAVTRLVWPAARATGVPFTFTVHAVDVFHRANAERNRIAEVSRDPLCLRVVCVGEFHRSYLIDRGVPAERITIARPATRLVPAADEELEARLARRPRVVATLARFVEKKGIDDLIRAAPLLPEGTEVRIHGYGPAEASLRALAEQVGVGERVRFMGAPASPGEVARALAEADVFALPCKPDSEGDMDGLPTVLGEAMAAGVPVVTTAVAAIPEVIRDAATGLLAPPGNPAMLARRIADALELEPGPRRELIAAARRTAAATWNDERTVGTLLEIWEHPPLDIVMVTHSRDEEEMAATTTAIVERLYERTTTPFNLTVVDNSSDEAYRAALERVLAGRTNASLVLLERNAHWGPAMNIALGRARSDQVIYVCSREGFVLRAGWERAFVELLRAHRDVALAGHPISSPAYPTGAAYVRQPWFARFRNKAFAEGNPDREFAHVQGGLFAIRRAAFERCGGFSDEVAQDAVDIEYSHLVESLGWKLGRVERVPSVTTRTRPPVFAHLDEHTVAAHPLTLESLRVATMVAEGQAAYCNLCTWTGDAFAGGAACPRCGSTPFGRLAYRWLARSPLPYRGLDCAAIIEDRALGDELERMFSLTVLGARLNGGLGSGRDVVIADLSRHAADERPLAADTIAAALVPGGTAIIGGLSAAGYQPHEVARRLAAAGLATARFAPRSEALRFPAGGLAIARGAAVATAAEVAIG